MKNHRQMQWGETEEFVVGGGEHSGDGEEEEYSRAVARERLKIWPPAMVDMERLVPGKTAEVTSPPASTA